MVANNAEAIAGFIVLSALAVGFSIAAHRSGRQLGLPGAAVTVVGGFAIALLGRQFN